VEEHEEGLSARAVLRAVPPGWVPLAAAAWTIARRGGGYIRSIKEKYARLSVFATTSSDAQRQIDALEEASSHMCEVCGRYGRMRDDRGWMRCLCERHWAELEAAGPYQWAQIYRPGRYGDAELDEIAAHLEAGGDWEVMEAVEAE
jgi:hypothetical protein